MFFFVHIMCANTSLGMWKTRCLPLNRHERALTILAGKETGLKPSPFQLVGLLSELARGKDRGWSPKCDEALRWLCELIRGKGGACAATGPECARLLKQISIVHKWLDPAEKEATIDAITARVVQEPIRQQLNITGMIELLHSSARSHVKNKVLCHDLLDTILHQLGNDLSKLRPDHFVHLMYSLPRHGVLSHPALPMTCKAAEHPHRLAACNATLLSMLLGSALALNAENLKGIAEACADEVKKPPVYEAMTEWESRQIGSVFAKFNLMHDSAIHSVIMGALETERARQPMAEPVYGMAHELISLPDEADILAKARAACRELRLLASYETPTNDLMTILDSVTHPDILNALEGEELYFVVNAVAKRKDLVVNKMVLQRIHARVVHGGVVDTMVWGQHITGLMAGVTVMYRSRVHREMGVEMLDVLSSRLIHPNVQHARAVHHHVGAMWAMGMTRSQPERMERVVVSMLRRARKEEMTPRVVAPVMWAAARVRLQCDQVLKLTQKLESEEARGQLSTKMLGLTLWAAARLQASEEVTNALIEDCMAANIPETANPQVISMVFFAMQLRGTPHVPFLDRLCDRLVSDEEVSAHFTKIRNRPQEIFRAFLGMKYHNTKFLRWMRAQFFKKIK